MKKFFVYTCIFLLLPAALPAQTAGKWENLLDQAYSLLENGEYAATLEACTRALSLNELPSRSRAGFLTLRGHALRHSSRYEEAVAAHQQALGIRTGLFGRSSEEVANCLQNIGNCYWDQGLPAQAALFFEKNLRIRQKLYPPGDSLLVVPLLNLGDARLESGRLSDAEALFQQALAIQWSVKRQHEGTTASLRCDLSRCFFKSNQPQRALDTLALALDTYRRLPNTPPSDRGECLALMGQCLTDLGENEAALRHLRQAQTLLEGLPSARANVLLAMARVQRYRHDTDDAIESLSGAVTECGVAPDSLRLGPLRTAIWLEFGSCFNELGKYEAALLYFGKALNQARKSGDPDALVTPALLKMGACRTAQGKYADAAKLLQQALARASTAKETAWIFAAHQRLGDLALRQGRPRLALPSYAAALQCLGTAKSGGTPSFFYERIQGHAALARACKDMAVLSGKPTDWQAVASHAQAGIGLLEQWKGRLTDERSETDAQEAFYQLYNLAIEACAALRLPGFEEKAFSLAERYRVQLFKKLSQGDAAAGSPAEKAGLAEEHRLREALAVAEKQRAALNAGPLYALDGAEAARLDSAIQSLTHELARRRKAPTSDPTPSASLAAIRNMLRPGQTFLEYQWGEGKLFAFLVRRDTFLMKTLPMPGNLELDVLAFFQLCHQNPDLAPVGQDSLPVLGHRLYLSLLAPLAPWIGDELVIVPDAWLCYLPFDALLSKPAKAGQTLWEHAYLVKEKSLGQAWSAALYLALKNRGTAKGGKGLLAFAPSFDQNSWQLSPLRHNVEEAGIALRFFDGKLVENERALEAAFREMAGGHRLLFLATHGVLDDRNAAWSYLAFSEIRDSAENEFLYAWEVPGLGLDADLVVLSACQTANGRMYRGEGLISLARAFQLAGAKSVVASLWNVDDTETPQLMAAFFEGLSRNLPKTLALAQAKRHYLQTANRLKTHPFFWSGFVASGDDGPLSLPKSAGGPWRWGLAVLPLLAGAWLWRRRFISGRKTS